MLCVASNCDSQFILDLIGLDQPLKLSKKSVHDETVFDLLEKNKRDDAVEILTELVSLQEFKKLKLAQRKKVTE